MGKTKLHTQYSPNPSVKIVDSPLRGASSIGCLSGPSQEFDLEAITNLEGSIIFKKKMITSEIKRVRT